MVYLRDCKVLTKYNRYPCGRVLDSGELNSSLRYVHLSGAVPMSTLLLLPALTSTGDGKNGALSFAEKDPDAWSQGLNVVRHILMNKGWIWTFRGEGGQRRGI